METAKIRLNDGTFAIVDAEDFERLSTYGWSVKGDGYANYRDALPNGARPTIYMHREIIGAKDGEYVDHINGDPRDNRKSNLRIVTISQNAMNRGRNRNNKSGYKGVSYASRERKWLAQIGVNGKNIIIGRFDCKHSAAIAYNNEAKKLHGEFAYQNEIIACNCESCAGIKI